MKHLKVRVKFSLHLSKHHSMKTYGGSGEQTPDISMYFTSHSLVACISYSFMFF